MSTLVQSVSSFHLQIYSHTNNPSSGAIPASQAPVLLEPEVYHFCGAAGVPGPVNKPFKWEPDKEQRGPPRLCKNATIFVNSAHGPHVTLKVDHSTRGGKEKLGHWRLGNRRGLECAVISLSNHLSPKTYIYHLNP